MQTHRQSIIETVTNTAVGFILSWCLLWLLAALFNWHNTVESNTLVTAAFTALSLIRGYLLRRFFNWWNHQPRSYAGYICGSCYTTWEHNEEPRHTHDCPLRREEPEPEPENFREPDPNSSETITSTLRWQEGMQPYAFGPGPDNNRLG